MNSNGGKPEPADPENAVRMLELELMRQRAARQQGRRALPWIARGEFHFSLRRNSGRVAGVLLRLLLGKSR